MRKLLLIAPLAVLAAAAGGCASSGKTKPNDRPDLLIPAPPPHVIPINSEPIVEPVADLPAPSGAASGGTPAGRGAGRGNRETPSKPQAAESKPEVKPDPPVAEPPPPAPPSTPAPQLRTAESSAAEGAVRSSLDRTKNLLANVDYRFLSTARKKAYDDAKRFMQQAEDSLKAGNAVFAQGVATKAETLARELANR